MKILIVSDTHGRHQALDRALEEVGKIDMFIHLGDVEGGEDYLEAVVECEKHIIRGNNDFLQNFREKRSLRLVLIMHYYPWTLLLCVHGDGNYHRRGQIKRSGSRNVWSYTSSFLSSEGWNDNFKPGKSIFSTSGGKTRQLYDHGSRWGRKIKF